MKCRLPENGKKAKIEGDVTMTSYDINKQLISQLPPMTEEQYIEYENALTEFLVKTNNEYYMLLNNDKHYYTLFHKNGDIEFEAMPDVLKEILNELGEFITWSAGADDESMELWVKEKWTSVIDETEHEEVFCYYLFGYDAGVVEVF